MPQMIFIEKPLLLSLTSVNPELWATLSTIFDALDFTPELPAVWHYAALLSLLDPDPSVPTRMQTKWIPDPPSPPTGTYMECPIILTILSEQMQLPSIKVSEYIHMTLAWRYNSFGHHTDSSALCMYDITSMMAHSCGSSGVWHFGSEDSFCLRARVALNQGDEITISYLGDEDLLKSIPVRRTKTNGWLFSCICVRCDDSLTDFSRGFRCPTCASGTVFFSSNDDPVPCTVCATALTNETKQNYLSLESLYADRVSIIDKTDYPDISRVYSDSLSLFSSQHWIPYTLEAMITEYLKSSEDKNFFIRIHLLSRRMQFLRTTYPLPNYTTAWLMEELAECYVSGGLKEEAASLLEQGYWMMRILCGEDHPFTTDVQWKWHELCDVSSEK